jgi:cellulose biosynthesis protein BcsQ
VASPLRVVMSSRKGGAGKTVVTVLLARELARQKAKVLVLDLDPQRVGSSIRLGADINSPINYTAVDLVLGADGRAYVPQAICPGHLDVIAGNQRDLASLERKLGAMYEELRLAMGERCRRSILDARLAGVESDFVLIDTPTGFGEITTNALEAAHVVISPIDMQSGDNVESVQDLLEHMDDVERQPNLFFLPNKVVRRELQVTAALARASALCGSSLLAGMALPASTAVPQAMTAQRDVQATSDTATLLKRQVSKLGKFILARALAAPVVAVGGA